MKLLVLTSSYFGTASECLPTLLKSESCTVVGVVVSSGSALSRWRRISQKIRKILRIGVLGALNGMRMRSWYAGPPTTDIRILCDAAGIPCFETDHTNGPETERIFRNLAPDLGISLGNGYIAPRIFRIPKFGMINVHGERLPQYQNAQSVIWPIYNGESMTGLSVHELDQGIDTGRLLYHEEYPIIFRDRLKDTVHATVSVTRGRAPAAVRFVCENFARLASEARAQGQGRSYTTPSIWQYLRMQRNHGRMKHKRSSST